MRITRLWLATCFALAVVRAICAAPPEAAQAKNENAPSEAALLDQPLELFDSLESNAVEARFVPANAERAVLYLLNRTKAPLNVELPLTLVGAPALPPEAGQVGIKESLGTKLPQILGSVVQTPPPNPKLPAKPIERVVTLAPNKVLAIPLVCVCLQYGNPTPRPVDPYTIKRVEDVTDSAEVLALLEAFAAGTFDQQVAQLAAWHFSNNLSGEQLAETGFAGHRLQDAAALVKTIRDKTQTSTPGPTEEPRSKAVESPPR